MKKRDPRVDPRPGDVIVNRMRGGDVKIYATSTGQTAEFECLLRNFWGPRMKR